MAPPLIEEIANDDEYESDQDSDFAPDAVAAAAESEASDSDSEVDGETLVENTGAKKGKEKKDAKRKRKGEEAEDIGYDNSGDEAIIGKGLKRRKKGKDEEVNEEGGEGGFVRTRAMKAAAAPEERRPLASTATSTVDVDALWKEMLSKPFKTGVEQAPAKEVDSGDVMDIDESEKAPKPSALSLTARPNDDPDEMVTIQHTYNFAGKVHSETKVVHRDSAEAQLYFQSHPEASTNPTSTTDLTATTSKPIRRPKARRSIFEPPVSLDGLPPRTDLRFKISTYTGPSLAELSLQGKGKEAKKLTTVEKSKMDWAGYVDKEGIKDDLETAKKAKGTYLGNQDFLAKVDMRREEEGRRARGVVGV